MEDKQTFGTRTTMEALKKQYGRKSWWAWFEETKKLNDEPVSIGHIKGPLQIDGDLVLDEDPWAVIIDGDVEVKGTVICQNTRRSYKHAGGFGKIAGPKSFLFK